VSLILDIVVLYLVKLILSLWVISLLLESLYIEVCRFSEVVFRRVLYFVVKERYIIIYIIVNL
jgi:hypothetical protein